MPTSSIAQDFLKYVMTGAISFGASLLYTNYRTAPSHNVTLVPVSMTLTKHVDACTVDQTMLNAAIEQLDSSSKTGVSPQQPEGYDAYLKALLPSNVVLQQYVPPQFLTKLGSMKILSCDGQADAGAAITLEAAALFDQPTPYLLRRSCSLSYDNADLPIRASAGARQTDNGIVDPDTVLIGETGNLMFSYDNSGADANAKSKVVKLVQNASEHDVELSIKCLVIGPDAELAVGGRLYTVRVSRPSK